MILRPRRRLAGLIPLLIASLIGTSSLKALADPVTCEKSLLLKQAKELSATQCVAVCNLAFENKTAPMTGHFQKRCEQAISDEKSRQTLAGQAKAVAHTLDLALLRCMPLATKKAAVGLYELGKAAVSALISQALGAAERVRTAGDGPSVQKALADCDRSPECRRAVARDLIQFQEKSPDGNWKVDDSEVDRAIAGQPLASFLETARHHRQAARAECGRNLSVLRRQAVPPGGEWNHDAHVKVYSTLAQSQAHCLGLLPLLPPAYPQPTEAADKKSESSIDKLSVGQKLAVGAVCLGDEFTVDFCAEIVQSLVFPVVRIQSGVQTAVAATSAATPTAANLTRVQQVAGSTARNLDALPPTALERGPGNAAANAAATTSLQNVPQSLGRQRFIDAYKNRVFSSEAQNSVFIARAEKAAPDTRFLDVENSVMKKLNDVSRDKNLVTSLTNLHKDIFLKRLQDLRAKYPSVAFDFYSDFKSVRVALSKTDSLSAEGKLLLQKDLDAAFRAANKEFADEVGRLGVDIPGAGSPEKWFKGAYGNSVDEVAAASRHARVNDAEGLVDASSPALKESLEKRLAQVDSERLEIAASPRFQQLLDRADPERLIPRTDVFDLTRKHADAQALADAVRARYQLTDFSVDDARKLLSYSRGVDEFSPPLLIAKREVLSLDAASAGALSADFLGLGSANLQSTARGIAGRKDLPAALAGARDGERTVTRSFQSSMKRFREIVGDGVSCSGDDCVQVLSRAQSSADKTRIVNALANDPDVGKVRMAFVGPGVPAEHRLQLAAHGESIEKSLRKRLEGRLPSAKLDQLRFGLDMQTVRLDQGQVDLIIGRHPSVRLSAGERAEILRAFREALGDANRSAYLPGQMQSLERRLRLLPGPGLLLSGQED